MIDRDELHSLSLDELRALAEQHGVQRAQALARSQLLAALDPAHAGLDERTGPEVQLPAGAPRLRGRVRRILWRVDRALGRSITRMMASLRRPVQTATATSTAASAASSAGGAGHGPGGQPEIVYPPPGGMGSSRASSAAAVRGPGAAAAAVDRAHLSEEMARLYAAEGHREEALAIYRLLLQERPGDAELQQRLRELELQDEERVRPPRPKLSPSGTGPHVPLHGEPFGMLDLQELPETYGVDEVEVLYKDPWWSFVYWEVTDAGIEAARAQLGPSAATSRLVLRLFSTPPGYAAPAGAAQGREIRDVPLTWNHGRRYIDTPRPGALLRVAVGLLSAEGYFAPIAHSALVRLPPPHPAPPGHVARTWLHVQPLRGRGEVRERLTLLERLGDHAERAPSWRVGPPPLPGEEPSAGYREGGAEGETYEIGPQGPGSSRAAVRVGLGARRGPGSGSGGLG